MPAETVKIFLPPMILGFSVFSFPIETCYLNNGVSFIIQNKNKLKVGNKMEPFYLKPYL